MSKLEAVSITKSFGDNTILQDVSLRLEPREIVCLLGVSGGGKTTLFNVLSGLTLPDRGQVFLDGREITGKAGHISYMLQKDLLLPWRSILDNIILGMEVRGVPRTQAVAKAMPLIEKYGLKGFDGHHPSELSGGMRQRAALLRTLLYDRDVLLLDEPFGALDAQTRLSMQNWLLQIWSDFKKTVLFVTHDIDEAIYLSDDIYVFSPRPGYIKEKITVDLPRPRTPAMMTSEPFMQLKHRLLDLLAQPAEEMDQLCEERGEKDGSD